MFTDLYLINDNTVYKPATAMLQCRCMCSVNSRSIKLFSRFTSALSSGTAQARRLRLPSAAAKPNTVIAGVFSAIQPAFHSHLLATRQLSYGEMPISDQLCMLRL